MNKKFIIYLIIGLVLAAASGVSTIAHTESDPFETNLIAGQHYNAGKVFVWNDDEFLHVNFTTANGWALDGTHLQVATSLDDIPQNNGNPPPGQFDYKADHDPMVPWFEYEIENIWDEGTELFIAAHADVCKEEIISGGLDDLEASLPDQVTVLAEHAYDISPFDESYFKMTISGGTSLDGTYNGWCVDTDHLMSLVPFIANVYSSYESIPMGLVENPENLDLINYIINQDYIGEQSSCDGDYTYGDVQRAIWELIEDQQSGIYYLGPWEPCKADEIVADAVANGEGFTPGCDQKVAILLEPAEGIGQVGIIEVPITCETDENCQTAWGQGSDFPGNNWAMYFTYEVQ